MGTSQIAKVFGEVFVHPESGTEYGVIRDVREGIRPPRSDGGVVIAEDACGNYFIVSEAGMVGFWDHETNEIETIAESISAFCEHCSTPRPAQLKEGQVVSAWIDPEFAKKMGIDVPKSGQIKKLS